jgi:hypothetical protein
VTFDAKNLILTIDDATTELRERGNDVDAYLDKVIRDRLGPSHAHAE